MVKHEATGLREHRRWRRHENVVTGAAGALKQRTDSVDPNKDVAPG